jgi:Transposase DNA-binding/Transposase DDE domain
MIARAAVGTAASEFDGAELGDPRRSERLQLIANMLEAEPAKSFPRAMGSDAALEGFYRFINSTSFGAEEIVAPHVAATTERASEAGVVIAVHDTTLVEYSTARSGLGVTTHKTRRHGFVTQVGLLLAETDGLPLGVAHVETLTRTGKKWAKRRKEGQRGHVHRDDSGRESLRWIRGVEAIEAASHDRFQVIHVTDAEGDFFELFSRLHTLKGRFVIRAGQLDRSVITSDGECSLRNLVDKLTPKAWRDVELCERKYRPRAVARSTRRRHPERAARVARLAIASRQVTLKGTRYSELKTEPFRVNVVRVWEPRPPAGQPPVEWVLFTTEKTSSVRALGRVVDIYRRRWTIEEYFKALKTGCSLEKRQVESYDALCKVLALFVPIAYRLLLLRGLERLDSTAPALRAFSPTDLRIMASAPSNRTLKPPRTVADALTHLARLGGHIKNNGPPGWQTLSWGYEKLLVLRLGWEMALASRSDQS